MPEYTREKRLRTRSVNGTIGLGEIMTELLISSKLVILRGDLGAGKTTLVKGIAAALGAAAAEEVTSPTFTLVHEYQGRKRRLYHLDLYRLETEQDVEGLGIWEMAAQPDALVMVEWGDKFPSIVERANAEVAMEIGGNETERLLHIRWR